MSTKEYRDTHKEEIKKYRKTYTSKNKEELNTKRRENTRKLRLEVLSHYGGKCACCGENTYEFLALDHINNDGAKHRKENNISGSGIYWWVKRNNYSNEFQILCHNCNQAKGLYGICPHKLL